MNYLTTPSSSLAISSSQTTITGIHFKHTSTEIKPYPSGISGAPNADLFTIYPNPSKGILQINWKDGMNGEANVIVMDITGRTLKTLTTKTNQSARINISELQEGIYFIKVASDRAQHTEKIILQH
jgi:hypothetical protein